MRNILWSERAESYEFFLFSMLYREIYEEESKHMAYDIMHEVILTLYKDFHNSPYDDGDVHLYDCIVDFLNDSKQLIITYGEKETEAV